MQFVGATMKRIFSVKNYRLLMILFTFPLLVPFLHNILGSYVKYTLVFGVIVLIGQLLEVGTDGLKKGKISTVYKLLFVFWICYFISIMINRRNNISSNINQWIYMLLFFLLLFAASAKTGKNEVKLVSIVIVLISFIFSILSLLTFVFRIGEWYLITPSNNPGADAYYFGLIVTWYNTSFNGICNPNVGAAISSISIILSLYLIFSNKNRSKKAIVASVLIATNILIQFLVLILMNSLASLVSLVLALVFLVFVVIIKSEYSFKNKYTRVMVAFLIVSLMCVVVVGAYKMIDNNKNYLVLVTEEQANNPKLDTIYEDFIERIISATTYDSSAQLGSFNSKFKSALTGRDQIWLAGIKVLKESPIFGLTREGYPSAICDALGENADYYSQLRVVNSGGLHNGYLSVIVSSGIIGFLVIAIAVFVVWYELFYILLKEKTISMELVVSSTISLFFLVSELAENRILYQVSLFNVVFWIYFGYMYFFAHKEYLKIKRGTV